MFILENKLDFFENGDYKLIANIIDKKIGILKNVEGFNKQYLRLYDAIDEMQVLLEDKQIEKFDEILKLFYSLEEYYLALAYSLGVKYSNDLKNIWHNK